MQVDSVEGADIRLIIGRDMLKSAVPAPAPAPAPVLAAEQKAPSSKG